MKRFRYAWSWLQVFPGNCHPAHAPPLWPRAACDWLSFRYSRVKCLLGWVCVSDNKCTSCLTLLHPNHFFFYTIASRCKKRGLVQVTPSRPSDNIYKYLYTHPSFVLPQSTLFRNIIVTKIQNWNNCGAYIPYIKIPAELYRWFYRVIRAVRDSVSTCILVPALVLNCGPTERERFNTIQYNTPYICTTKTILPVPVLRLSDRRSYRTVINTYIHTRVHTYNDALHKKKKKTIQATAATKMPSHNNMLEWHCFIQKTTTFDHSSRTNHSTVVVHHTGTGTGTGTGIRRWFQQ